MCINMYIVVFTDSVIVHLGYEFYTGVHYTINVLF